MKTDNLSCPVCGDHCTLFDVVDLNKSCEEMHGLKLPLSGIPVCYVQCGGCGFCFAPELYQWSREEFSKYIYNEQYVQVDPDYLESRPKNNANRLQSMFPALPTSVRHLDYGGGNGLLAKTLGDAGWNSTSFDPFVNTDADIGQLGQFDLITVFEVFEHVPDVQGLMSNLKGALASNGVILLTTLLSDANIQPGQRLSWWYASPRNGHISLFSRKSLTLLAKTRDLRIGHFSKDFHVMLKEVPAWAGHLFAGQK
jgi:SAM-dependent methyltransferase